MVFAFLILRNIIASMNSQLQSSELQSSTKEYTEANAMLRETQERALRVSEALYRTTDLFSDNEPLKWSLRESAINILQTVTALDTSAPLEDFREARRVEKNIRTLLVKIELAASGAFMARKNFEVLRREYLALRDLVATSATDSYLPLVSQSSLQPSLSADLPLSGKISGKTSTSMLVFSQPQQITGIMGEKQPVSHHTAPQKTMKNQEKMQMSEIVCKSMSERKDAILRFIRENGPSGVGGVSRSLESGISEKTVQRDLNVLVESGLLRKEGERRWRRYFV